MTMTTSRAGAKRRNANALFAAIVARFTRAMERRRHGVAITAYARIPECPLRDAGPEHRGKRSRPTNNIGRWSQ